MTILLISPTDPKKFKSTKHLMGGENTYTRTLLKYPPEGVKFIHFEEALKQKQISYHWTQQLFLWLQRLHILPVGPRVQSLITHKNFDAIYAHCYPIKIIGHEIPTVISNSSSDVLFLKKYLLWARWRIWAGFIIKKYLFGFFRVIDGEVNLKAIKTFFVFSQWAQNIKQKLGIKNCQVIYPGVPKFGFNKQTFYRRKRDVKLLFIGAWFERKGGRIVLEAWRRIFPKFPDLKLTIIGGIPKDVTVARNKQIIHHSYISYVVLKKLYATHDILVHVPPEIEGFGMTVLEAMSAGMAIIVSNVCALPELINHQKTGIVVQAGSVFNLEQALLKLITNSKLRERLGKAAYKEYERRFSTKVFNQQLLTIYG